MVFVCVLKSMKESRYNWKKRLLLLPGNPGTRVVLKKKIDYPGSQNSSILDTLIALQIGKKLYLHCFLSSTTSFYFIVENRFKWEGIVALYGS